MPDTEPQLVLFVWPMQTKWVVSALTAGVLVWRHDTAMAWCVIGAVLNGGNAKLLKRLLNVERPATAEGRKSDPGMPSSHAQSLGFLATSASIAGTAYTHHLTFCSNVRCYHYTPLNLHVCVCPFLSMMPSEKLATRFDFCSASHRGGRPCHVVPHLGGCLCHGKCRIEPSNMIVAIPISYQKKHEVVSSKMRTNTMMLHNLMSLLSAHFVHWFQYHSCTNIRLHGCVQAWLRVATGLHTPLQVVVGGMVGSFTALLWSLLWERNIFPALASETAMRVVEVDDKKMALLGDVVQSCSVPLRVLLWGACLGSILLFGSQVVVKWSRKQRPSLKPSQEKVDNKNR